MEREFFKHCRGNNLEGVNDCLSRGVDVNSTKEYMYGSQLTGLMVSCHRGHSAIVSRLVQVPGLDINYQEDEDGQTAALLASENGHTECVRILAETDRVDWNKADKKGETPLYFALYSGHSDIVDIIVQQPNIDYNVKMEYGVTLAQAATWGGNVKCVETLAAQERCDCWNVPDRWGLTPIMKAVQEQRKDICNILLKCPRVDVNLKNMKGQDLMMMARNTGNTETVKLLEDCQETKTSTSDIQNKMSRIQDVMEENEGLKSKMKEMESEILLLRTTYEKYGEDLSGGLQTIETEMKKFSGLKEMSKIINGLLIPSVTYVPCTIIW